MVERHVALRGEAETLWTVKYAFLAAAAFVTCARTQTLLSFAALQPKGGLGSALCSSIFYGAWVF